MNSLLALQPLLMIYLPLFWFTKFFDLEKGDYGDYLILLEHKGRTSWDDAVIEARSVEEAIAQMSVADKLPVDKHPEKRLKVSFKISSSSVGSKLNNNSLLPSIQINPWVVFAREFRFWMDRWFMAFMLGTFYKFSSWNCIFNQCIPMLRWKRFALVVAMCMLAVRAVIVQIAFYLHIQTRCVSKARDICYGSYEFLLCCYSIVQGHT